MFETFEDGIQNWCLPLNHMIGMRTRTNDVEYANTSKACRRISGPFDPGMLNQAIGGNVRLYSNQEELYDFTRRLRDAQLLRREAILPTENGGYKLQLAINEVIRVPTLYAGENVTTEDNLVPRRFNSRTYSGGRLGTTEANNYFEIAEKRYLLDQALDHELDALIITLKHNLNIIGYPID